MAGESVEHLINVDLGQRINQFIPRDGADLDQADLLGISVQTVGLRIHRHPRCRLQHPDEHREFFLGINHLGFSAFRPADLAKSNWSSSKVTKRSEASSTA